MNINLHVERLVLEGIEVPAHEGRILEAAVSKELARLVAEGGMQPGLTRGGAMAFLRGGRFQMDPGNNTDQLGQQIARAVYGGVGK